MWIYEVDEGKIFQQAQSGQMQLKGTGYSGKGEGKNNPAMERIHNVGPIPRGRWNIGKPFDSPEHGKFCLPLLPYPGTETYGRFGFLCHGDSIEHPGEASKGCIVMPRIVREAMDQSNDFTIEVV